MAGIIRTIVNESIRTAIRGTKKNASNYARDHMPNLEKSAVTRGDVAHVTNKVEQVRQDMHSGFDDIGHLTKANADHVVHAVQDQSTQLSEQIGHLAELIHEHSSLLQELIRVLEHFH